MLPKTPVRTAGAGGGAGAGAGAEAGKADISALTGADLGAAAIGAIGNTTAGAGKGYFGDTNIGRMITGANFGATRRSGAGGNGASKVARSTICRIFGDDAKTAPSSTTPAQCNRILPINARRGAGAGTDVKITLTSSPQYSEMTTRDFAISIGNLTAHR